MDQERRRGESLDLVGLGFGDAQLEAMRLGLSGLLDGSQRHYRGIGVRMVDAQHVDADPRSQAKSSPRLQDRGLIPPQLRRWRLRDARLTAAGLESLAPRLPPHTEMFDLSRNDCGKAVGLLAKRMEEGPLGSRRGDAGESRLAPGRPPSDAVRSAHHTISHNTLLHHKCYVLSKN